MKNYFVSIFISAIIILVIQILSDTQNATKPYIVFITGLVTILILFNPFVSIVQQLANGFSILVPDAPQYSVNDGNDALLEEAENTLSRKIQSMVQEQFAVKIVRTEVTLKYDTISNLFYIERILVIVEDELMIQEIETYLSNQFSAEITVERS